jgi:hypothetical protein
MQTTTPWNARSAATSFPHELVEQNDSRRQSGVGTLLAVPALIRCLDSEMLLSRDALLQSRPKGGLNGKLVFIGEAVENRT